MYKPSLAFYKGLYIKKGQARFGPDPDLGKAIGPLSRYTPTCLKGHQQF